MLSVTGLNHFYYVRDFSDMRCKHSRVLSIIREQLHREPNDGDVFIVMSKDRRIVRMFTYDNRSYSLFEKKFVSGYQFMKVCHEGGEKVYRIDWRDVVPDDAMAEKERYDTERMIMRAQYAMSLIEDSWRGGNLSDME